MRKILRMAAIGIAALLASMALTVSFPLINWMMHGGGAARKQTRIVAQVGIRSLDVPKPTDQPRRKLKQPARAKPMQANVKAGPRFAMDLGVGGLEGASVPMDIVNRPGGGGGQAAGESGDVDERPSPSFPPPFRIPPEIKASERDSYAVLSFCVDAAGRPYDVRVVEEKPAGMGMAQSGREALRQTTFSPARKDGLPVAFCGLEQPFEVKFGN